MIGGLLNVLMFLTTLFLIMLILVQRGRGGGLTGALGGMGGQSAFGTKAGDLFTRITIGVAIFWILLCMLSVTYFNRGQGFASPTGGLPAPPASAPAGGLPAGQSGSPAGGPALQGGGADSAPVGAPAAPVKAEQP